MDAAACQHAEQVSDVIVFPQDFFLEPSGVADRAGCLPSAGSVTLSFTLETLVLRLRHTFGTSHSSTTERRNALISCKWEQQAAVDGGVDEVSGWGESGLPPKKPKCYLADVDDCRSLFKSFTIALQSSLGRTHHGDDTGSLGLRLKQRDPFSGLEESRGDTGRPFPFARDDGILASHRISDLFPRNHYARQVFVHCLNVLDEVAVEPSHRAAKSGIEAALLDTWCKCLGVSFQYFAQLRHPSPSCAIAGDGFNAPTRSFYTAALNPSIEEMKRSTEFGLAYTSAIKIKLDSDVVRARCILDAFAEAGYGLVWSIDANAAWSADVAEKYVALIQQTFGSPREGGPVYPKLLMVEQPWSVTYVPGEDGADDAAWRQFRASLNAAGVRVYADESIATADDVQIFGVSGIVDGVNIKIEKAGGIRDALRAAHRARELGLFVWIGTMVSSSLGCCQAAQVAVVADDSDVDGGLLTFNEKFDGGFTWRAEDGGIVLRTGPTEQRQREERSLPPPYAGFGVDCVA